LALKLGGFLAVCVGHARVTSIQSTLLSQQHIYARQCYCLFKQRCQEWESHCLLLCHKLALKRKTTTTKFNSTHKLSSYYFLFQFKVIPT